MPTRPFLLPPLFLAALCLCAVPAFPQSSTATGKLRIHVAPKQAYVFVWFPTASPPTRSRRVLRVKSSKSK